MTNDEYACLQNMWLEATGIKEGSWVKVTRSAKSHESGWGNSWWPCMNKYIGNVFIVDHISGDYGICLNPHERYHFPFFILEPAEAPKPEKYQFTPFEQVLVRDYKHESWRATLFSRFIKNGYPFGGIGVGNCWRKCIPYAGHEHLLGTKDEPEDWAKYYDKE